MTAEFLGRTLNALNRVTQRAPWLVRGGFNRVYRGLGRAGLLDRDGFTRSFQGPWLRTAWDDVTFRLCACGFYGYFLSDLLARQGECVFLDIGANQGLYTLIAARNPKVRAIHAFEPNPEIHARLLANIERNGAAAATAHRVAIADRTGRLTFAVDPAHSGVGSLRAGAGGASARTFDVDAVGGEDLDALLRLPPDAAIVAKIDVEGVEPQVVAALARAAFWPRVHTVFFEVDEEWYDPAALIRSLEEDGFRVAHRNGGATHYDLLATRAPAA